MPMHFSIKQIIGTGMLLVAPMFLIANPSSKAVWELGIGFATFQAPQYRGDDRATTHFLPFPYFIYRGAFLNIDREGVQGLLFESELLKINLSGNASSNVDSNKSSRRPGMPDLDRSIEIGPALDIILAKDKFKETELGLSLTVRSAFSTNFSTISHQGWTANPHLYYFNEKFGPKKNLDFALYVGPVFADKRYHQYYYRVDANNETATRPQFNPSIGYSGLRTTLSLSHTFGRIWLGAFLRFDNLNNTSYDNSPLIAKRTFLLTGIALTYLLTESKTAVDY